jgi:hypothetical protein
VFPIRSFNYGTYVDFRVFVQPEQAKTQLSIENYAE